MSGVILVLCPPPPHLTWTPSLPFPLVVAAACGFCCVTCGAAELRQLAEKSRLEKAAAAAGGKSESKGGDDDDTCEWTPQTRVEIAEEQAEQKRQEEERKKAMQAPERNYEREHQVSPCVSHALEWVRYAHFWRLDGCFVVFAAIDCVAALWLTTAGCVVLSSPP